MITIKEEIMNNICELSKKINQQLQYFFLFYC